MGYTRHRFIQALYTHYVKPYGWCKPLLLANDTVLSFNKYKDLFGEALLKDLQFFNNPESDNDCVNFIINLPELFKNCEEFKTKYQD